MGEVIRSCIICRKKYLQKELQRYVLNSDEQLIKDTNVKQDGRGYYVCSDIKCIEKLKKYKIKKREAGGRKCLKGK